MGSIFDIPTGLLFVLSLVTVNSSEVTTAATGLAAPKSATSVNLNSAPCRHGEQAWLAAIRTGAGGAAFANLSQRIFKTSGGRYYVPVVQDRAQILNLRRDNAVSCFIAMSSAARNAQLLKAELNREATLTELYLAHVFGAEQASRLLKAMASTPKKRMSKVFPALDTVEPNLYLGRGKYMTLGGFSHRLKKSVRNRVRRASANKPRWTKKSKRSTKLVSGDRAGTGINLANAPVVKTHISARDLLRRGSKISEKKASQVIPDTTQMRFGFGRGLTKILQPLNSKRNDRSIAF